jgi:hypothetical protein
MGGKIRWLFLLLFLSLLPVAAHAADQPKLTVSGYILFDYEYYLNPGGKYSYVETPSGSGVYTRKDNGDYNAFEVTRTYLHFKLNPVDKMKIQLTLDSKQDTDGLYKIFVKYAFVQYDLIPEARFSVGLQQYPWAGYIYENVWPYLMMERGYFTYWDIYFTADFGATVFGSFLDDHFKYYTGIFNGQGYSGLETDKFKEYMVMLVGSFGDQGSAHGSIAAEYSHHNKGSASFVDDVISGAGVLNVWRVRLGGEYFYGTWTVAKGSFPEIDPKKYPSGYFDALKAFEGPAKLAARDENVNYGGGAVYLVVKLHEELDFVGRYDFYDPNLSSQYKDDAVTMWMAGLVYKLPAGVEASLDFRQYIYEGEQVSSNRKYDAVPQNIIYTHWKIPF